MWITAHNRMPSVCALRAQVSALAAPLAALSYPFILMGFNASVTTITKGDVGALPWLVAAVSLLLAFAVPTIALLAAMHFAEIRQPTAAQLRARRVALLAVAAPTLFTFIGVVLYMLHDPVPDTWIWVAGWMLAVVALLRADSDAPAPAKSSRPRQHCGSPTEYRHSPLSGSSSHSTLRTISPGWSARAPMTQS